MPGLNRKPAPFLVCVALFLFSISMLQGKLFSSFAFGKNNSPAVIWAKKSPCREQNGTILYAVHVTHDGGCIAAGYTQETGDPEAYVTKLDKNGNNQWTRTFAADYAYDVLETADSMYVAAVINEPAVTGGCGEDNLCASLFIVKLDEEGDNVWEQRYDFPEEIFKVSVYHGVNNTFLVSAETEETQTKKSYLILMERNGSNIWQKTFSACLKSIVQTEEGQYIATGYKYSQTAHPLNSVRSLVVVKIDTDGRELWEKTYVAYADAVGGEKPSWAEAVDQTSDGGYILSGSVYSYATFEQHFFIMKLDAEGRKTWSKMFDAGTAYTVQQTADSGYIAAGCGVENVLRLDEKGNKLWSLSLEGCFSTVEQTSDGGYLLDGEQNVKISSDGGGTHK